MKRQLSWTTKTVLSVLGNEILAARRRQRRKAAEVAERAGISLTTLRKIERGDPTVAIGTVFEVATLLGVQLVAPTPAELRLRATNAQLEAVLLPARVRTPPAVDNNF